MEHIVDNTSTVEPASSARRNAMRLMALAGSGTVMLTASARAEAQTAHPTGPWIYIPPGSAGTAIQAAMDQGGRAIQLGVGTYPIYAPLVLPRGCTLSGVGQETRLVAAAPLQSVILIGNGSAVDGIKVENLVVDCSLGKAQFGLDLNIVGTTGNYQGEPDAVCRIDNLCVYDPALDGIVYRGTDTQAIVTSRTRVRRAGRYGFRVECPDSWWLACEATTTTNTGSSAGFYVGVAIAGSNGIGAANNFFQSCKAWYCHDYGFHVKGTRNKFIGCESQDTRSHGWFIEWDQNLYTACSSDSAGCAAVGGAPNSADGFYLAAPFISTTLVGCQGFSRNPTGASTLAYQRYGFNLPKSMISNGLLVAATGWNNMTALTLAR